MVALAPMICGAQQVAKSLKAANGASIGFYEYRPADYATNTTTKYPLIIFLHGIDERGNGTTELSLVKKTAIPKYIDQGKKLQWTLNGKTESFIILSPQLSKSYSSWQNFYVDEMINYAIKNLRVDPNRIILTGLSLGGGGTWRYASSSTTNASKLAAIAPMCGTNSMSSASNIASSKVAVWGFHNRPDGIISYTTTLNAINKIKAASPVIDPLITIYPTGSHNAWDKAYDFTYNLQQPNIWEWFLGQNRSLAANKAPIANAGADVSISTTIGSVSLKGTGTDSDGKIERYCWKRISGPSSGTIASASSAATTVSGLTVAGTYEYELTVMDNRASWAKDTVKVTVSAGTINVAPVARAGSDINIQLPTNSVSLNGSSSTDADGTIVKFAWTKVSTLAATIASPSSASTSITGLVAGTHTFRLTVTDNAGASHSDDIVVTVKALNVSPVARAGSDVSITLPTNSVSLNGSSSSDADGSIVKFAWTKVSTLAATISAASSASTTVTGMVAGTHTFRLTVTDNNGASHSDNIVVVVNPDPTAGQQFPNMPPVANAGSDRTITLPTNSVSLSGSGSKDPDGTITKYSWTKVSSLSATISSPSSSSTTVSGLVAGTHTFRLTVTDDDGATHSDDVKVTVNATANIPPVSNAGPDRTITSPTSQVLIDAVGCYDPDGTITAYSWTKVSGGSAHIYSPTSKRTSFRDLVVGTYVFRLTVTDNNGAKSSDDVTVIVKSATTSSAVPNETVAMESSTYSLPVTENLEIFPNPASNTITLNFGSASNGETRINVYDAAGRIVKTVMTVKGLNVMQYRLDISELRTGLYHAEVIIDGKTRLLRRFSKIK